MNSEQKVKELRDLMLNNGIDFYIIPTSDPHMSEYVMDRYKERAYMTNFTGSAGIALLTQTEALLWADGRYYTQAEKEIKNTPFKLMKMGLEGVPTIYEFIKNKIKESDTIGFNGQITPYLTYKLLKNMFPNNRFVIDKDLVGEIWKDRPDLPNGKAFILDESYTGESPRKKIESLQQKMKEKEITHMFISELDHICYLLNIRGTDDLFTPILLSYLLIEQNRATIYVNENKIDSTVSGYLSKNGINKKDYNEIESDLTKLTKNEKVWISESGISSIFYQIIENNSNVYLDVLPSLYMKAVKNEVEIGHMKKAHIADGAQLTRFLYWMKTCDKTDLNEYTAAQKLHELRSEVEGFISESFATISAYKSNAAMAHYQAFEDDNAKIENDGLYLIDSGGQYKEGTTDVTRTITLGNPTPEEIKDYTLTLKAHIDLYLAKFIKGTTGFQLDIIARSPLWKNGIDFKHGTGHGVGFVLGVHEGPQSISYAYRPVPLEVGMIVSNEPGVYREGKHGIRIENLLVVENYKRSEFGTFYGFSNLTYVPYEKELIDISLLNEDELNYLREYNSKTRELLIKYMKTDEEVNWLKEMTSI